MEREEGFRKVSSLREGEDNISVKVRVLKTTESRTVETRKGPRTISEAVVGDETGRVKMTLWGKHAGSLKEGQAIEVNGAWTTAYRGEVQLNVGFNGEIKEVEDGEVPAESQIPETVPKAQSQPPQRTGFTRERSSYRRGGERGFGRSSRY